MRTKIIDSNSAFPGRRHISVSGQFPPQAALEVLNVPNRQLEFPGLVLWLAPLRERVDTSAMKSQRAQPLRDGQIKHGRQALFSEGEWRMFTEECPH